MAWEFEEIENTQGMAVNDNPAPQWEFEELNIPAQTVLDDDSGELYAVPVTFDEPDTRFAIATQAKGEDKADFFGKVKAVAKDAWDFTLDLGQGIEETIQSAERGIVGHVGDVADTALHAAYHVPDKAKMLEEVNQNDFSRWGENLSDEKKQEIAARVKEANRWIAELRAKNKAFWAKGKEILRPEAEMDSKDRFVEALGGAGASIGEAIVATLATKSPTVASGLIGTLYGRMRYTEYFDKALESGMDIDEADENAVIAGTIEGGIELVGDRLLMGIAKIKPIQDLGKRVISSAAIKAAQSAVGKAALRKIGSRHVKSIFAQALKGFATEGGEEAAQTYLGMKFENATGVSDYSDDEILSDTLFSLVVGGLPGAGTAVVGTSIYNHCSRDINAKIKKVLETETPELKPEESQVMADAVQEMLFQEAGNYVEEMNAVLQKELDPDVNPEGIDVASLTEQTRKILKEHYQMSDEEINKTLKVSLGFIDARNQFNEAYTSFREALENAGRKDINADAEARILSARAVALARAENKTVNEILERWNLRFEGDEAQIKDEFNINLANEEFLDRAGVDMKKDSQEVILRKIRDYQRILEKSPLYQGQITESQHNVELSINSQEEMQEQSEQDFKNKMLETLKSFKGNRIFNKSLNADIEIRTSSIKKYKSFFADKNKRLIVPYIPELLAKAKFDKLEDSYIPEKETNIKAYYKADLPINIDNDIYNVHLTVKEDNRGNLFWDAQVQEKSPSADPATNPGVKGLKTDETVYEDSITLESQNVNNPLYQGEKNPRGAYHNNIIQLFQTADASTVIHELAHFFLDDMRKFADNETTQAQLEAIYKYVGAEDGSLNVEQHEYFARSFEAYLMDGRSPNQLLSKVFARFKKWLRGIYKTVKSLNVELTDEMRKTFDDMLGGRSLDFAMQVSGAKMAESLESGIIAPNVVSKTIKLLDEGKMSRADMDNLIEKLKTGELKRKEFNNELKKFENSNVKHNERLNPFDKLKYKELLSRGNFNKRDVVEKIKRILKWSEPKKVNGKLVGRFPNLQMNKQFEHIRELMALEKNEAKQKIAENVNLINAMIRGEETGNIEKLTFDNKILSVAAGKAEARLLIDVYNALSDSYNAGRLTTAITGEAKRKRKERLIGEAIDVLTGDGSVDWRKERSLLKQAFNRLGISQMSWNGILDILSANDKKSKTGLSRLNRNLDVFENEQKEQKGIAEDGELVSHKIETALKGTANPAVSLSRYMNSQLDEQFVIEWGHNRKKFTKDQLIDIYMKAKDHETRELMKNDEVLQFNDEFLAQVNELLTDDDVAVAKALFDFYDENYDKINRFYEDKFGTSLGKRPFYSPRSMDKGGIDVTTGELSSYAGFSGIKERTAKAGAIKIKGAFKTLNDYIVNSNHYIAFSDKLLDINAVLGDVKVKNIIRNLFGEQANKRISYEISRIASNDKVFSMMGLGEVFNKVRSNYAVSVLGLKPALAIKQLTSFPAYWEHMTMPEFLSGMADFAKHPKEAMEILGNTTLMKSRDVNIIKDFEELSKSELLKKGTTKAGLREMMMLNIRLGDRGAIYLGGWALYKSQLKKNLAAGMDETTAKAKALDAFERVTDETQQSGRLSQQSYWQSNPFLRAFTMFQSSQNQYLRKEINAVRGVITGRMDKSKATKTLFIYHVLLPCLFQYAADGFRWDEKAQLKASLLGSLNGIFALSTVLSKLYDITIGGGNSFNSDVKVKDVVPFWGSIEDLKKQFIKYAEDGIEAEDYFEVIKAFGKPLGELAGVPIKYPLDVIKNFGDYAGEGDYGKEVLLWLGWSPYALRDFDE